MNGIWSKAQTGVHIGVQKNVSTLVCALLLTIWRARAFSFGALALAIVCLSSHLALAFMESEDQQFQADIDEAKKRANDFKRTMDRIENDQRSLEAAGKSLGLTRELQLQEAEQVRLEYVHERNARPSVELATEILEKENERQKVREAEQMEANRREYIQKRDGVRRVLERDAYIDEKLEYGL